MGDTLTGRIPKFREASSIGFRGLGHAFVLLAAAALSACAGSKTQLGGAPDLTVLTDKELPAPRRDDAKADVRTYYIGPFDKLLVDVFGIEELKEREIQVDAGGRISFPLAGVVDASGLTPSELQAELARRLVVAHVRTPQVTVNLKETLSQNVTVEGQVKKPGVFPVVGRLTLMGAVAKAEGTDEFSKLDDVIIFRRVGGSRYAALYDLKAIRHGAYADPEVYAGDVVMVGESRGRRLFKDILQIVPLLTTPLIVSLDRFRN